jgi:hypothetical protein
MDAVKGLCVRHRKKPLMEIDVIDDTPEIPPELKEASRLVDEALTKLGEHCDGVQIFCTVADGGCTHEIARGTGNWYARYGHVIDWVEEQKEATRANVRIELDDDEE